MGRPRGFDEAEVVRAAAALFAGRVYDGVSVDDLVTHLGVHRNSLYKTFGSKRGLYLAALRRHVEHEIGILTAALRRADDFEEASRSVADTGTGLDFLLLAAAERAPVDDEVAAEVNRALNAIDEALGAVTDLPHATAALLGLRLRAKAGPDRAGATPDPSPRR
ncbi:TetR/AcrR family transcriptional regulator [Saccharothrix texasensis]|uniref:TetR family transcriptional regulator n=1 Tax=Saccharothrix texasensis TaxID=103734 RepID=A0A3N1HID5_9PSEU|nr:TetR/AcrR family transcriptional regulator [Saccharothrix texasensis]ROP42224.1 TetR family transcriptional regulator [Saccharothrix texasensis]